MPGNIGKEGGENDNIIRYGSELPPDINFSAVAEIDVPVHIFSAGHDQWAHKLDTEYLYK